MRFLNGGAVDHENTDPKDVTFLMPRGSEPYVWTTRRMANNTFVGWSFLFQETKTLAEIGYRLRREDWGKGLAENNSSCLLGF